MPSILFTELANAEYNLFIELVYGEYTVNWVTIWRVYCTLS